MADGRKGNVTREAHLEQRERVRRAVDREQQREVYATRGHVDEHGRRIGPDVVPASESEIRKAAQVLAAAGVPIPLLPGEAGFRPAGAVKVGTEREGWRARLALVESLLAKYVRAVELGDVDADMGRPDSDVVEALGVVRGMIDGVFPDEPTRVPTESGRIDGIDGMVTSSHLAPENLRPSGYARFCTGCQRVHQPPVAERLSDPCPLEVTS